MNFVAIHALRIFIKRQDRCHFCYCLFLLRHRWLLKVKKKKKKDATGLIVCTRRLEIAGSADLVGTPCSQPAFSASFYRNNLMPLKKEKKNVNERVCTVMLSKKMFLCKTNWQVLKGAADNEDRAIPACWMSKCCVRMSRAGGFHMIPVRHCDARVKPHFKYDLLISNATARYTYQDAKRGSLLSAESSLSIMSPIKNVYESNRCSLPGWMWHYFTGKMVRKVLNDAFEKPEVVNPERLLRGSIFFSLWHGGKWTRFFPLSLAFFHFFSEVTGVWTKQALEMASFTTKWHITS